MAFTGQVRREEPAKDEISALNLPGGCRRSVRTWFAHRENRAPGV